MIKHYISLALSFFFLVIINAQTTAIPDANFEQALIDLNIDSDGVINHSVLTSDILNVTSLDLSSKNISSLVGIEDFTSLTYLNCFDNSITTLDISNNTALTFLSLPNNMLTGIDLSQNTALTFLSLTFNSITNLNVSQNTVLESFSCGYNKLTTLDISQNTALTSLYCQNNTITGLNVSQNTALLNLGCANNKITQLDLSQNTDLITLSCYTNLLTSLDVSQNTALTDLYCYSNQIVNLDLSQNTALTSINCRTNKIEILNVKNGQNDIISLFDSRFNGIICIDVDDAVAASAIQAPYNSGWYYDYSITTFSENCAALGLDDTELGKFIHVYPNPVKELLHIDSEIPLVKVELYSVLGQKVLEVHSGFNAIPTLQLSKGMYVVKLFSEAGTVTKTLIKD